ncbi:MAG TPA: tyrosine-type recombinase/integrase [Steroidobacteraceae bacterium]|nr:tyrosine-type recombinase/integrase [Steroidobacteraceae bacterium]
MAKAKKAETAYPGGKLVANALERLEAGKEGKPKAYSDAAQTGLQFVVRGLAARRSRTWVLRIEFRTEPTRLTLGHWPKMSLADARETAHRLREQARRGIDPRRARQGAGARRGPPPGPIAATSINAPHSVGHLADEFLTRYVQKNRKRPEDTEANLKRDILRVWRNRDARSITPREVVDFLDEIVDRGAPVVANRTANLLDQMFRFGIQRRIVESSPVMLLTPPGGKEKARKRTLDDDELKAFLADPRACTRQAKLEHIIMILLLTGARRGELAQARWDEIDWQAKTWTVPDENHKEDEGYICPLTPQAIAHFRALQVLGSKRKSPWICPAKGHPGRHANPRELSRRLARCRERFQKQGIEDFTLHDLRRTVRTGLARLGVLPHIAERILSHAQPGIVGVYDRYQYLEEKRAALKKWSAHVDGLRSEPTGNV